MIRLYHKLISTISRHPRHVRLALVVAGVALAGLLLVQASRADSIVVHVEAESGLREGNSVRVGSFGQGASENGWVQFGHTAASPNPNPNPTPTGLPAPTGLVAWTGGDSIALQWDVYIDGTFTYRYEVYRNGTKVGTTAPNPEMSGERYGTVYIDKAITKGTSYSYTVKAIGPDGKLSPASASLNVTHPPSSIGVPKITVDPLVAQVDPDMDRWYRTVGIPMLQTWYPKLAQQLAYPGYTPHSNLILSTLADWPLAYDGLVNEPDPTRILIRPGLQKRPERMGGVLIHEAVHVMQFGTHGSYPSWMVEGVAEYTMHGIFNYLPRVDNERIYFRDAQKNTHFQFNPHYGGAVLYDYIHRKVDPTYMRRVMSALHSGTVNASLLHFPDGRDINQIWGEIYNLPTRTGGVKMKANTNKCIDSPGSSMIPGTQAHIWDCNGSIAQKVTAYNKDGSFSLTMMGYCLGVFARRTANGTPVEILGCSPELGGKWTSRADGSLVVDLPGNKCLDASNSSTANGTKLQLWDCNGSNAQRWTLP